MIIIREAKKEDVEKIIEIEKECFPPAEAAKDNVIRERFEVFSENFLVAEVDGKVVGFINGCTTENPILADELYYNPNLHNSDGDYQTVFGLDVLPNYRRRRIAKLLMEELIKLSRERGKKGIVLTCKDYLIDYYSRFGFVLQGVSISAHGGAKWNDMYMELKK